MTSKPSPTQPRAPRIAGLAIAILALAVALAFSPAYPPALAHAAVIVFPPNYNPMLVISDDNWRAAYSMSAQEIQAFLDAQPTVLKSYSCAEGGPNGLHSQVVKPAAQIIAEAAQYWNVNPKLIIATLEKEQSLISQPWHTGQDIDPTSTHLYSTEYHLTNAMGCGVYAGSPDRHPGFGDQVWTGAGKLAAAPPDGSTSPYRWWPGKVKTVYSYPDAAYIDIVPLNQVTWNLYTYTPYYPQLSIWKCYNQYFGDPLVYPGKAPIYRFYNRVNGSHFYTASETERYVVSTNYWATYTFEGAAYSIATTDPVMTQPLFRFYNKRNGSHFYTASYEEADYVIAHYSNVYTFEGPAYNVSLTPEGCQPVYRFYNKRNGSHFYTVSLDEANSVILNYSNVYTFEGTAYWVKLAN